MANKRKRLPINNKVMPSEWVLQKVMEIKKNCVGILYAGFEDQYMALFIAIEIGHFHPG